MLARAVSLCTHSACRLSTRTLATVAPADGLVLGCGSNVVDMFYRLKALPAPGEKGYFADERILHDAVVGGKCRPDLRSGSWCWFDALLILAINPSLN
jgi:hypothetical protein